MKGKFILLIVVLAAIIVSILYIESLRPDIPDAAPISAPAIPLGVPATAEIQMTIEDKQDRYIVAPELIPTGGWLNSEPMTIGGLRGKVVLVDFWTYSCINCIRTLPYLTSWDEKYSDAGLVILGVHTPEFTFEKKIENVKRATEKHGVKYAVVQDNDFLTWRAYKNAYWPRKYLIDIDGFIRYDHIGEGAYDDTEEMIQLLLAERMERLGIEMDLDKAIERPEEAIDVEFRQIRTPEQYFGYGFRRTPFGNAEGYAPEKTVEYAEPFSRLANVAYNVGTWTIKNDYMELESDTGKVLLKYSAKAVNIVASSDSTIEVYVDGKLVDENAGDDVVDGVATIGEERLYTVVFNDVYAQHDLELRISGKGFRIYTFTFG